MESSRSTLARMATTGIYLLRDVPRELQQAARGRALPGDYAGPSARGVTQGSPSGSHAVAAFAMDEDVFAGALAAKGRERDDE